MPPLVLGLGAGNASADGGFTLSHRGDVNKEGAHGLGLGYVQRTHQ